MKAMRWMIGLMVMVTQVVGAASLGELKTAYSNAVAKISADNQKIKDDALTQYGKNLGIVLASLKQKGDIDGYTVVDQELKRFQAEKEALTNTFVSVIANVVSAYQKQMAAVESDSSRRTVDLLKRYVQALDGLVKSLMAQDRTADAKAAGNERKAAEFLLAEIETGLPKAEVKQAALPRLTIVKATFGTPENGLDFTEKVRLMVRNNRLEIPASLNKIFGDVAPYKAKVFKMDYTDGISTNIVHKEGSEKEPVVVEITGAMNGSDTQANPKGHQKGTLTIVKATFGVPGKMRDVTDRVKELAGPDTLDLPDDNVVLGYDPVPNQRKTLTIEYTVGAGLLKRLKKSFMDGERVVVP